MNISLKKRLMRTLLLQIDDESMTRNVSKENMRILHLCDNGTESICKYELRHSRTG